jgi:hypothetical protein
LASEVKVLREAAEQMGQMPKEPVNNNNTLVLAQQNNTVNLFDRSSVLALAAKLRNASEGTSDNEQP